MRKNVRNIQTADSRLVTGAAFAVISLIAMVLLVFTWVRPAFAAEGDIPSVTVTIKAGEHGSVNEKTGEFTEAVAQGESLKLMIGCDEGYVIGRVLLNDEPLAASDLKELLGASTGELDLEELDDDLSVEIIFMTTSEFEIQKEYGQVADDLSGDDTGADDSQQTSDESGEGTDDTSGDASSDTNTDPSDGAMADLGDDTAADSTSSESSDDEDNAGADSESDDGEDSSKDLDSLIDSTEAEDGDETDDNINWGTTEDSEVTAEDTEATAVADTEVTTGEDYSADDASDTSESTEQVSGTESETKVSSKAAFVDTAKDDSDSTDDGKGDYYDTPKTGDERNPLIWLAMLISGLVMITVSAGSHIRSAIRKRDRRWSS